MSRPGRLVRITLVCAAIAVVAIAAIRQQRAAAELRATTHVSARRQTDLATIAAFTARHGDLAARLPSDVLPTVQAALSACSLPASTASAGRLLRDEAVGTNIHRREYELVLEELTPGQLGAVLSDLGRATPRLRSAEIRLSHQGGGASPLDRNRYSCTVRVSTVGEVSQP